MCRSRPEAEMEFDAFEASTWIDRQTLLASDCFATGHRGASDPL